MLTLEMRKNGEVIETLELVEGTSYTIGRSPECDLVIEGQRGISRVHLTLSFEDGAWVAQLISKVGDLFVNGAAAQRVDLSTESAFSIPPFQFRVKDQSENLSSDPEAHQVFEKPDDEGSQTELILPIKNQTSEEPVSEDGATALQTLETAAFLNISDRKSGLREVIRLLGSQWVIGRDPSSTIIIESPSLSRKHFEIQMKADEYFVKDLGSSNGLKLNGESIDAGESIQLTSGDLLQVRSLKISFEIRDPRFEEKMLDLPAQPLGNELNSQSPFADHIYEYSDQLEGRGAIPMETPSLPLSRFRTPEGKKQAFRLSAIGVIVLIFGYFLFGDSSDSQSTSQSSTELQSAATKEQIRAMDDTFQLANSHYTNGEYELCIGELDKLKLMAEAQQSEFLPKWGELASFCHQGVSLMAQKQEQERQLRQKKMVEQKIQEKVNECRGRLQQLKSEEAMSLCLADAIEYSPEHPLILELLNQAQNAELELTRRAQLKQDKESRIRRGKSIFNSAKTSQKNGDWAAALKAYQNFLNGGYGPNSQASQARSAIKQILAQRKKQIQQLNATCENEFGAKKYKEAFSTCRNVLKKAPSSSVARNLMEQSKTLLKREMKMLYEDSVVEEGLGNVELAKERWRKILASDIRSGHYYRKAASKLKKYGIELTERDIAGSGEGK